jgi:hypothetical protein
MWLAYARRMHKTYLLLVLALASCSGAIAQEIPEVVRAKRFEIVGDDGTVRCQINVEPQGDVVLRLRDQQGVLRVKLGASTEGSGLVLNNDATEPGLHALATSSGSTLKLRNKDGKEMVLTP